MFIKKVVACAMAMTLIFGQPAKAEEVVVNNNLETGPARIQVTCYTEAGKPTCTGSYRTAGVAAGRTEWLGYCAYIYEINPDGSIGDFIDIIEFNDIGYGAPIGHGTKSDLKKGQSAGSIETGKTIDIRRPTYSSCQNFMKQTYTGTGTTGSEVYMILVNGCG